MAHAILAGAVVVAALVGLLLGRGSFKGWGVSMIVAAFLMGVVVVAAMASSRAAEVLR
jgi:hypothetical protein